MGSLDPTLKRVVSEVWRRNGFGEMEEGTPERKDPEEANELWSEKMLHPPHRSS